MRRCIHSYVIMLAIFIITIVCSQDDDQMEQEQVWCLIMMVKN